MNSQELFNRIKADLELKLHFLEDKPEETIDSTLRACWFKAYGIPRSPVEALKYPLPDLTAIQINTLQELLEQRINNTPLAYLTGRQHFMGIELLSDKRALIPRKETEILGKTALAISRELAGEENCMVMDICCGAGNLGLALAYYNPDILVFATDLSADAIELARENILFLNLPHRIQAEQGDLFSAFEKEAFYGKTGLIVCNPPYISSAKVTKMNPEIVNHEPVLAFDGGMFGTTLIQKFIREAPRFLSDNGSVIFEVGVGQGEFIMRLIEGTNLYKKVAAVADDENNIRVITAQKSIE